jgi:hypothetical protein
VFNNNFLFGFFSQSSNHTPPSLQRGSTSWSNLTVRVLKDDVAGFLREVSEISLLIIRGLKG